MEKRAILARGSRFARRVRRQSSMGAGSSARKYQDLQEEVAAASPDRLTKVFASLSEEERGKLGAALSNPAVVDRVTIVLANPAAPEGTLVERVGI